MLKINEIYCGDCLKVMKEIDNKSIDMILCDLPYEETGNKWDSLINLNKLFDEYRRILKENGCIALNGTMKFGFRLYGIAQDLYKYEWIWAKDNGTNAPNVNLQPFRIHEYIFIFGKGRVTNGTRIPMKYFPQKTQGNPYKQKSGRISENWKGGLNNIITDNKDGLRHPLTIQYFQRDKDKLHPTQKPVALCEYLIKTYTNEGELVLDNCIGSGTTCLAAKNLKRNWIGIELNPDYCKIAYNRIHKTNVSRETMI